jgi:hypothetical protein
MKYHDQKICAKYLRFFPQIFCRRLQSPFWTSTRPLINAFGVTFSTFMHDVKRLCLFALVAAAFGATAWPAEVPIYKERPEARENADITNAVQQVRESGKAIHIAAAREQLRRPTCKLELPKPNTKPLSAREVWQRAREAHIRIGWSYLCTSCEEWHLSLAGGYALTADGAVGASYHSVEPGHNMRQGFLIAMTEDDKVFPVTEVLAANRYGDTCILKVQKTDLSPLPLSTNAQPGDVAYCFSDPLGRRGYFTRGIVNRFFRLPDRRLANVPGAPAFAPIWMNVDTDWGPGSSGSAVVDEFGNVIGQVATISVDDESERRVGGSGVTSGSTPMVFHDAVSARDVFGVVIGAH